MKNTNELFEQCQIDDLKNGYCFDQETKDYVCLICGKRYQESEVLAFDQKFYQSEKSMQLHIAKEHGSVLNHWLSLDKKVSGLSEQQVFIIELIVKGLSDKEIALKIGDISESTVRNHRFNLREKARQARIFLAIMNAMEEYIQDKKKFVAIPRFSQTVDARHEVTNEDKDKLLAKFFNANDELIRFPKKEKERLIILQRMCEFFDADKKYKETEVDHIIRRHFLMLDFVMIRRALIDYGFMLRKADGSEYWLK